MDGLIATVVGGVIVTVLGAILAFYFGGLREEKRQRKEAQRAQRDQQIEKQRKLGERRLEALSEIQTRARALVEDLRALAERVPRHIENLPEGPTAFRTWFEYFDAYEELANKSASVSSDMASLRAYYRRYEPYFEPTAHGIFESFSKEFDRQHTLLSQHLYTSGAVRADHQQMKEMFIRNPNHPLILFGNALQIASLGTFNWLKSREYGQDLRQEFSNLIVGIKSVRKWDFEAHDAAFDEEIQKISDALP